MRQQLLISLHQPYTVAQLANKLSAGIGLCSREMAYLVRYHLVICLTPQHARHRVFWLTTFGADCQRALLEDYQLPEISHHFPDVDYATYSLVCSRHRKSIVKRLTAPANAVGIRKAILHREPHQRMSSGNTREALRQLHELGVVERAPPSPDRTRIYMLTELGKELQRLLWRSEEKPWPGILKL